MRLIGGLIVAGALLAPGAASAFCGFYVGGADASLFNNATQVVLMRDGTRTVLAMQNDYQGPPDGFAMVVPVPVVLQKENVKTLSKDVFDRIDKLTAPRLVEYWEQDPCPPPMPPAQYAPAPGMAQPTGAVAIDASKTLGVTVEAKFSVGEYEIVILSAKDSSGLDTWLRQEKYKIPAGAEPYLKPYVAQGSKFFVAKVDAKKVKMENGHAALSPLRFHYDSTEFNLPVRLGLINSSGTQDLIVNILAQGQRYEPANYPSVTIPTNFDVVDETKGGFGRFYAALFDKTIAKNKNAIVTEYSWDASTCDPCPGPALDPSDFATLGGDAVPGPMQGTVTPIANTPPPKQPAAPPAPPQLGGGPMPMPPQMPVDYTEGYLRNRVQQCWQASVAKKPQSKGGRLDVRITRTAPAQGAPQKPPTFTTTKNETGDTDVAACVAKIGESGWPNFPMDKTQTTRDFAFKLALTPQVKSFGWTVTRLHARYTKDALGADIVFRAAPPIVGGREVRNPNGELEHGSSSAPMNNFQGRYAIRHPWTGPITCASPRRGVWGGPPAGTGNSMPVAAQNLAFAPRENVQLASFLRSDVPELDLKGTPAPITPNTPPPLPSAAPAPSSTAGAPPPSTDARGCHGCATTPASHGAGIVAALLAISAFLARRRR